MTTDESWAEVARGTRRALAELGHPITPLCLPDEADPCGGTFTQHALAHLATIKAVADHQLEHLGPAWNDIQDTIYWNERIELERADRADADARRAAR